MFSYLLITIIYQLLNLCFNTLPQFRLTNKKINFCLSPVLIYGIVILYKILFNQIIDNLLTKLINQFDEYNINFYMDKKYMVYIFILADIFLSSFLITTNGFNYLDIDKSENELEHESENKSENKSENESDPDYIPSEPDSDSDSNSDSDNDSDNKLSELNHTKWLSQLLELESDLNRILKKNKDLQFNFKKDFKNKINHYRRSILSMLLEYDVKPQYNDIKNKLKKILK